MDEKKSWFGISLGCVGVSIISLFLPVIIYLPKGGTSKLTFNIIDMLGESKDFNFYVLHQYYGPIVWDISEVTTAILTILVLVAILCAVGGIFTLRAQRPNTWQFVLTIIGLVGVAIPSIVLIVCVLGYGKYFEGSIGFGVAPIITPLAMITCIITVIGRKNRVAEQLRKEAMAKGLIREAGDL